MNKEIYLDYKFPYDGLIPESLLVKIKKELKKGKKKPGNHSGSKNNMPKLLCGKNGVQI